MQRVECNEMPEFPISEFPYLSGEMFSNEMLGAGYLSAEISFRNAIIRKNGSPHSSFRKTWSAQHVQKNSEFARGVFKNFKIRAFS